jgi:N,N'-diacetyllegionaminate synthase
MNNPNHVYIIAEIGINHDGSMDKAKAMIREAKAAGADAVKFQTYRTRTICKRSSTQWAWLKKCELSFDQFRTLVRYAKTVGIDFISTPDDTVCADFLASLKPKWMKIGSAKAKDPKFLGHCCNLGVPLIVSTGMATVYESWAYMVPNAMGCAHQNLKNIKAVLHCTSSYPCPPEDLNLNAMTNDPLYILYVKADDRILGLSDHTPGVDAAVLAVGLGARMLEKHFDIPYQESKGPDRGVSTTNLDLYVSRIRRAEIMLGDGIKRIMPSELATIKQLKARQR